MIREISISRRRSGEWSIPQLKENTATELDLEISKTRRFPPN
jgi:hypothetical protein